MASLNEENQVEQPFIEQLQGMGWQHLAGDIDVPDFTERTSFRDVLLQGRLLAALNSIPSLPGDSGNKKPAFAVSSTS